MERSYRLCRLPIASQATIRAAARLVPPLLAYWLAHALIVWSARAVNRDPSLDTTWFQLDANLYLTIAKEGLSLVHCTKGWGSQAWCGTAGWSPLYPWIVKACGALGASMEHVAVVLPHVAAFGVLAAVWNWLLDARLELGALLVLAAAAVFPGLVYQYAAFPISLTVLWMVCVYASLARGKLFWAAGFAALAGATYASAVSIAPIVGLAALILPQDRPWRIRVARGVAAGLIAVSGYLLVLGALQLSTGHWDAYFMVQAKYGFTRSNPLAVLLQKLGPLLGSDPHAFRAAQDLVVAIWVFALLPRRTQPPMTRLELLVLLHTLLFWLLPLVPGARVSTWRVDGLLLPSVLLGKRLSPAVLAAFVVVFALLAPKLAGTYFTGMGE